jgi:putative redox protein
MRVNCTWIDRMKFEAISDGHKVVMDAKSPLGTDSAPSPKSMVLVAICGCTAMDVIALMKKYKQEVEKFDLESEAIMVEKQTPKIFKLVNLVYRLEGKIEKTKLIEAVRLSQSQFCSVSAMIARVCPIEYKIYLNNEMIGEGRAAFPS